MKRRTLLGAAAALPFAAGTAPAQGSWPSERPIRIVITYPPGGTSDFVARTFANQLGQQLGQSVVVENRSGGGGVIGWTNVVRSAPDGYTFLLTDNSLATAPALLPNLGFDINADLTPVSLLVDYPCIVVVGPEVQASTMGEFVALAKSRQNDQLFYGSMGNGSSPHLYAELLQDQSGMKMTHVPYRGMGPAFTDLLAGRVALLIAAPATVMAAIKAGRVKALAIGTPGERIPALPDVPTLKELGFDFTYSFWYGLLAPKGLPQPIAARMQAEVKKAFEVPEFRNRFVEQGGVPVAGDGEALAKVMRTDYTVWGGMIRERNIKPD
ncbi:Bug family tripartite tricarboxylate transporter substrate binding protein [Elioraea rosea]|uniref:Bug family tripartite tricarboxylate transporter substrate binding protein n=1 Tax=Elioraea rosea TaxID=2492390 RepID=UPI0013155AFE|nr:tripartite tricarboxylate transporter substrate binding protein [Elioraea rosea]